MVHCGALWYTVVYCGALWCIVVHCSALWCTVVHFGALTHHVHTLCFALQLVCTTVQDKNIARMQNCPDITMLSFIVFVFFISVFLSFYLFCLLVGVGLELPGQLKTELKKLINRQKERQKKPHCAALPILVFPRV